MKDINLMPDEIKSAPAPKIKFFQAERLSIKTLVICLTIIIFVLSSIIIPKVYVARLQDYSASIKAEIESNKYSEVKKLNKELEAVQEAISLKKDVISNINDRQILITNLINYVKQAAPKGITINAIDYGDNNIAISGNAKSSIAVAEFISNLTRQNMFSDYTSYATLSYDETFSRDEKSKNEIAFKIEYTKTVQGE